MKWKREERIKREMQIKKKRKTIRENKTKKEREGRKGESKGDNKRGSDWEKDTVKRILKDETI